MGTITRQGDLNTTGLLVPDLYPVIVPPKTAYLNGVPTNVLGIVGTATWGPIGTPQTVASMDDYARLFGPVQNGVRFDMGTIVATAIQQGANNIRCVRASGASSVAASATLASSGLTLTSLYTGTDGNNIQITLSSGSQASTTRLTIAKPGWVTEVFDNVAGTGSTFWTNLKNAVNNGQSGIRGPSQLVVASANGSVAIPSLPTTPASLASGVQGTAAVASDLIGVDTTPRTGMYALRGCGCSVGIVADVYGSDSTWATQLAFAKAEGIYMILVGAASESISTAVTQKTVTTAVDDWSCKVLLGDWIYWYDSYNGVTRLVSPQGFVGGRLANLSPEQSGLNKPLFGIVGTQRQGLTVAGNMPYSTAELQTLVQAGIDVITAPSPGGNYYALRIGHNASSNPMVWGDNYTRLTNYVAATINAGMGGFIGRLQTVQERRECKLTLESFFGAMQQQNMIGAVNGGAAYQVILDATNNPMNRVALGFQQADIQVVYWSVIEKFLINIEGGQSVQIARGGVTQLAA